MSRRVTVLIVCVAATAAVALLVLPAFRSGSVAHENDWPTVSPAAGTLTNTITAVGTIKPGVGGEVKVGSQVSGVVEKLRVKEGDVVHKGDVLAILNTDQLRTRVDSLAADLLAAQAEVAYAEKEFERYERVPDISRSQVDDSRRNADVKRASVQKIEADLKQAQIQLDYATITAPLSGTIESVSTYEGETVAASFSVPAFVTIVDLNQLEVQCYVDETDVGKVRVGQRVEFTVDAFPAEVQRGIVRTILPKAEQVNSVVNYVVVVDILDKGRVALRPQMTARVNFVLETRNGVISLPRSALLRDGAGSFVLVRSADGWARRAVRLGMVTAPSVEITSGVTAGDTVLADAQLWKAQSGSK